MSQRPYVRVNRMTEYERVARERGMVEPIEFGSELEMSRIAARQHLVHGLPWASEALGRTRAETVFYVGEMGGCTADDQFHMLLMMDFKLCERIDIPRFYPVHDFLGVWRR